MDVSLELRRLGYRLAYRLLQVVWFLTRPHKLGVKCVVTNRDRVLLVRHTYGSRSWDLPGGAMKRHESPLNAAQREMNEELGLDGAQWSDLGEVHGRVDHRRDTIHCFSTHLQEPKVTLDRVELETAEWFAAGELPADVAPYVGEIIARTPVG